MDYRESLDCLYGLQQFGIKLGLENIRTLLARLSHPEHNLRIVHVGGSNGKGSVCACLAEILKQAGYRTGLYTSPHLHSFTERIRIDGIAIEDTQVAALTDEIRQAAAALPVTFFEFTTAMALLHFHRQQVDFAVFEVGMGGRLDATNVVEPQVTVITPVCRDHMEHLGEELSVIAGEKGGIIKAGVPLVLGRQSAEAHQVLARMAAERQAPVTTSGEDFFAASRAEDFSFSGFGLRLERLQPGLPGRHQHDNLSLALAAAALLRRQGVDLPESAMRQGVAEVSWAGRLEWWGGARQILLDGAHNEGGAQVLARYLDTLPKQGVRWVVGLKKDKRIDDILAPLLPHCTHLYCTTPPIDHCVPPEALARAATAAGCSAKVFAAPAQALAAATGDRQPEEIVLVAGSLFLVAAARECLLLRETVLA